jgi:hexosaminidase
LCPRIPLYFDFIQDASHKNGRTWGGKFCTLNGVYNYPDSTHSFSAAEKPLVKGVQGNLWTERFETEKQLDFMMYPRILALAESAWTEPANKDYERFTTLMPEWYDDLKKENIYYFNVFNGSLTPEPKPINKQK